MEGSTVVTYTMISERFWKPWTLETLGVRLNRGRVALQGRESELSEWGL
jgi:hypothetical protein